VNNVSAPPQTKTLSWDIRIDPASVVTPQQFADALVHLRERAGLTVRELAKATGVPFSTIGSYMAGRHLPPLARPEVLRELLCACGVVDHAEWPQWYRALQRVRRIPGRRPAAAKKPYSSMADLGSGNVNRIYGREQLTHTVIERIAERRSIGGGIVTVTGASGSGKSMLLRGSVIPTLQCGGPPLTASGQEPHLLLTPGTRPLMALASAYAALAGTTTTDVMADLQLDPARCRYHLGQSNNRPWSHGGAVVVVDQFDDVFSAQVDQQERQAFFDALRALSAPAPRLAAPIHHQTADTAQPAMVVVLALRSDSYQRALHEPGCRPVLRQEPVVVGPMSEPELRNAIVAPVHGAGLDIDDGLVELLLRDMSPPEHERDNGAAHETGALPLLSLTLDATWQRSARRRMTVAAYREAGGFRDVVARTADGVFDSLSSNQQELARRFLLRLVRIRNDGSTTRCHVTPSQLSMAAPRSEVNTLTAIVDRFVDHRLVTVDTDKMWITHDAVLTAWPRLRGWIEEKRESLHTRPWQRGVRHLRR
jgi:hypothetical protein